MLYQVLKLYSSCFIHFRTLVLQLIPHQILQLNLMVIVAELALLQIFQVSLKPMLFQVLKVQFKN